MNKIEIWNKYELFELFTDLDNALELLGKIKGGYSQFYSSAEDFYIDFEEELMDLKHQNVPDFKLISSWLGETSARKDFVGYRGMELANRILERAQRWNRQI